MGKFEYFASQFVKYIQILAIKISHILEIGHNNLISSLISFKNYATFHDEFQNDHVNSFFGR